MKKFWITLIIMLTATVGLLCGCGGDLGLGSKFCEHDFYDDIVEEPTCETMGRGWKKCTKCNYNAELFVSRLGHKEVVADGEEDIQATCTVKGYTAKRVCSVCGKTVSEGKTLDYAHLYDDDHLCRKCGEYEKHTITFDYGDGREPVLIEALYNKYIDFPDDPISDDKDKVFDNWYCEEYGHFLRKNMSVDRDITVIPWWQECTLISNADGLAKIAQNPEGNYALVSDINMQGESLPVIEELSGILDGRGHKITDAQLVSTAESAGENFGFIRVNHGKIRNIEFVAPSVSISSVVNKADTTGKHKWGFLAGVNKGTIDNVTISGGAEALLYLNTSGSGDICYGLLVGVNENTISSCTVDMGLKIDVYSHAVDWHNSMGYRLGGIAGRNNQHILNCDYKGDIKYIATVYGNTILTSTLNEVNAYIGGIAGENISGKEIAVISGCSANTNLTGAFSELRARGESNCVLGGAVGLNSTGIVSDSKSSGSVYSNNYNLCKVGGFVGSNEGASRVQWCYSTSEVNVKGYDSEYFGGGFVGYNAGSLIQKSYSTGNVTVRNYTHAGGFAGANESGGQIRYSYSTGNVEATRKNEDSKLGNLGYFVGKTVNSSAIYACRYVAISTISEDGAYVAREDGTTVNQPMPVSTSELWSEHFMSETLGWVAWDGWLLFTDDNPLLNWELQRSHLFESKIIEPTHEYGGYTLYRCTDCRRVMFGDFTEPLGHDYQKVETVAPTCTEQGYDIVRCIKDGCEYAEQDVHVNFTEALGHDKGTLQSTIVSPTCGAAGSGIYNCTHGEHTFEAEIPATNVHFWQTESAKTRVPCTKDVRGEDGYSAYRRCAVCGAEEGKTYSSCHTDANRDSVCDYCGGYDINLISGLSKNDFVKISTAEDLQNIVLDLNGNYILNKDIDLKNVEWLPIGDKSVPFTGTLYGNGYKIVNLNLIAENQTAATGLFAYNSGTVVGVTLENCRLSARNTNVVFGCIAAYNSGIISDCKVIGENVIEYLIQKTFAGERGKTETHIYSIVAGGVVGINEIHGLVTHCTTEGSLQSKNAAIGGITAEYGTTLWTAAGSVLGNYIFGTQLKLVQSVTFGGLIGRNNGTASSNFVKATVNVFAAANAQLNQLKGKVNVLTNLYAGSIVGVQAGTFTANTAAGVIGYEIPDAYKKTAINYVITGKTYEVSYEIANHSKDGDGKIGLVP